MGINFVFPMGTCYQFYLILFNHYYAALCIRKEFVFCRSDKVVNKVPENKYL